MNTSQFWNNRSVFITGHTGFKGAWLSLWLASMGAKVHGYSLGPPTYPNFFDVCKVRGLLTSHTENDICNRESLASALWDAEPEIIFHLAAQPLVRDSYRDPITTINTNILGATNILDLSRYIASLRAIVNVTSDKCYDQRNSAAPFVEQDPLGGDDCYSASKACSEIITHAYRRSFLSKRGVCVATARAGNVIGGGDWARDRLIPDFFRAVEAGNPLRVRNPTAVRPWQHVLDVLRGYLLLAQRLVESGESHSGSWNFGPDSTEGRSVRWVLEELCVQFPGAQWEEEKGSQYHEAAVLSIDSTKAKAQLNWFPTWSLSTAIKKTVDWHISATCGGRMEEVSLQQIREINAQRPLKGTLEKERCDQSAPKQLDLVPRTVSSEELKLSRST